MDFTRLEAALAEQRQLLASLAQFAQGPPALGDRELSLISGEEVLSSDDSSAGSAGPGVAELEQGTARPRPTSKGDR